uniref:Biotin--[acetyl-CoA-carboxylase] ligase n=1 Tax=Thermodesulfobacterium geofontis TaxID=1295609 RepID=A0A7V5XGG7_9BACT
MDLAKKLIYLLPEKANGRVIRADFLSKAKGRFDRKWFALEGGVWMAISIYDEFLIENSSLVSIIFGLAMQRCANYFGINEAKIKWINDLHLNGKKIGGVLIERFDNWYIAGIGLNVNNPIPSNISATSFKEILGKELSIFQVLENILYWLRYYFGFLRFYERKKLEEENIVNLIVEDFKIFSDTIGRCVIYTHNLDKEELLIIGKVLDITEKGTLLMEDNSSKEIFEAFSGEIFYIL